VSAPPAQPKLRASALGANLVVLASPSAANGFVNQVDLDSPVEIYTIGPSTTDAARALGLRVTAEAREPSLEGILEAMQ
jgi:uroporphyrinogen-III synthase